jgi:demethylmenaquinone methyltransferase/2-methoxy-6-polyprenyl-1,4-benzoquinol methylase
MSQRVVDMFARVAERYDRANTFITAGLHRRWRRRAVRASMASSGMHVLDCATGTGDFALEFLRVVGPRGSVTAIDICEPMLAVFRRKMDQHVPNLRIEYADMLSLPYSDGSFDVTSCGYGIRNADDPLRALAEMARVTRAGGRVVILETGVPSSPLLRAVYAAHTRWVVPLVGRIIAGDREAYEYLPRTAAVFPYGEQFIGMMEATGAFAQHIAIPLLGGASYIYVGVKRS